MDMYDKKFVIMLDKWLDVYPDHWAISAVSDTIEDAKKESQTTGNPAVVPRKGPNGYTAVLLENKSLIDSQFGSVDSGGIYYFTQK